MEIPEVLFAQAGLLVDFDGIAREGGGRGVGRSEGIEDAFGCFAGAAVGRCEEVEGVRGVKEGAQLLASFFCLYEENYSLQFHHAEVSIGLYLLPAIWSELDAVIRYGLVNVSVFWLCEPMSTLTRG